MTNPFIISNPTFRYGRSRGNRTIFKLFKITRKQMSKTVSTRLQNEIYEKLISKCEEKGITVNEFLKECIHFRFNNSESKTNEISKPVLQELSEKDIAKILGISINQK